MNKECPPRSPLKFIINGLKLSIDTLQPWILQTIINHEGHEDHEVSVYVLNFIMLFFVPFVSFVVIFKFICRLNRV